MTRRTASVMWELSEDEGMVVVDVDAPLRPFGSVTPPKGTRLEVKGTDEDAEPADDPMAGWGVEETPSEGRRRTLPPIPRD